MLISIAIFIWFALFGLWFVVGLPAHSRYYGIIKPQKPKHQPSLHSCKMPFFDKPIGTLYRCKYCGNVWLQDRIYSSYGNKIDWRKVSLDDWKSAGGSSME